MDPAPAALLPAACGLKAGAAAAAEAARELREAAAALVATRAVEEDALRRRAVALDADVRRLQGALLSRALDPGLPPPGRALPQALGGSPPSLASAERWISARPCGSGAEMLGAGFLRPARFFSTDAAAANSGAWATRTKPAPVYDDDIFDAVPGLRPTTSAPLYDDGVFGSSTAAAPGYDILMGFGSARAEERRRPVATFSPGGAAPLLCLPPTGGHGTTSSPSPFPSSHHQLLYCITPTAAASGKNRPLPLSPTSLTQLATTSCIGWVESPFHNL